MKNYPFNMWTIPTLMSGGKSLILVLPALLAVAFVTVAERKTMASMQRRLGPNSVGYYGLLQAFADALKLLLKEYVSPTQSNNILFFLGPIITLVFSLLAFAIVPLAPGLALFDINLGIFYFLAVGSIATYGILLAGWSANSKYPFLGALRSTAQLISYELIFSSVIFLVLMMTNSLSLTVNIEAQRAVWFFAPLLPIFFIFCIAAVAETNRAPFDLAEAESELVSGFMTEHSSVIFVFFFLAEYGSLVIMSIIISDLFLGGYTIDYGLIFLVTDMAHTIICVILLIPIYMADIINYLADYVENYFYMSTKGAPFHSFPYSYYLYNAIANFDSRIFLEDFLVESLTGTIIMSIKTLLVVFVFIWVRASFPRIDRKSVV